jgi:hypothetical protein
MRIHWAIIRLTNALEFHTISYALRNCISSGLNCFLRVFTLEGAMSGRSKRINLEEYRKLVAMQAWKAWRRLPMQTRIWIGIEDMIEDGMRESWKLTKTFNPRWASFTTALFHRLHHFYINEYLELHSAHKRGWVLIKEGDMVEPTHQRFGNKRTIEHQSVEALVYQKGSDNADSDGTYDESGVYPPLVVSPDSIVKNVITECFVVPALEKVYKNSSPRLQDAFVEWFLKTEETRIHKKGKPFKKAAAEFRELCKEVNVTCDDCIHLVRSPSCLDTLSRDLFGVPRDLNYPTPIVERML